MKAAFTLAAEAVENGWTIKIAPGRDTGENAFITLEGVKGLHGYFSATWHTRDTGTYRLFNSTCGTSRHQASVSSLRKIRQGLAAVV